MTIENKIKRVRELDQAATPGPWQTVSVVGNDGYSAISVHLSKLDPCRSVDHDLIDQYRTLAPELADKCEQALERVKEIEALREVAINEIVEWRKDTGCNSRHLAFNYVAKVEELEAGLKALKDKQVDLIAKAYDEGRNYVDDRGSEE